MNPRPCSAVTAVARAARLLVEPSNAHVGYQLGTGGYDPSGPDLPWTHNGACYGSDCAGFALSWCYKLQRHRPGFNRGAWSTISDDLNSNSAIEDADHDQDLFRRVAAPMPGDLLAYPTFRYHIPEPFIGHVAIVVGVDRAGAWDPARPAYHLLDIVQVCGGPGRMPAAIATDGSAFDRHDTTWPAPILLAGMADVEDPVSVKTVMIRALP